MQIKISSNAKNVHKFLGEAGLTEVFNRATSQSIRQTTQFIKREGARDIVASRHAPRLKVGDILPRANAKAQGKRSMVWDYVKADQHMNWWDQEATIRFSPNPLKPMYFAPEDVQIQTGRGVRWGVYVSIGGKRILTGGFHLRSMKGGLKRRNDNKWGAKDFVFKREGSGLRMYWFPSVADIMQFKNTLHQLEEKGTEKFERYWLRNFDRYSYQVFKEFRSSI